MTDDLDDPKRLREEYALVMRWTPPKKAADRRMLDWLYNEGAHGVVVLPHVVVAGPR